MAAQGEAFITSYVNMGAGIFALYLVSTMWATSSACCARSLDQLLPASASSATPLLVEHAAPHPVPSS